MANLIAQGPSKPPQPPLTTTKSATTKATKPKVKSETEVNEEEENEEEAIDNKEGNIEISMCSSDLKLPEKKARAANRSSVKKKPENSITFRYEN